MPTRKVGRLLGAHWSSVARWLIALETLGRIRLAPGEVHKRGGIRCPRYYYGQASQTAEKVSIAEPWRYLNPHAGDAV